MEKNSQRILCFYPLESPKKGGGAPPQIESIAFCREILIRKGFWSILDRVSPDSNVHLYNIYFLFV